uniref:DNA topoisomerase n=1 Tax=viral metagenome TaxID=1070528 RepID=A0A6C0FDS7_9ZZZZ|tara:strand:+ start:4190 stop:5164 length:975 start_codon:yes stop_codon:yes gene_type:complete
MKEYIKRTIKKKRKDKYTYDYRDMDDNKVNSKIANKVTDSIYIPPAYDDVKINLNPKEKVLAIGYDEKQRPQYVYNKKFTERNSKKKFHKMIEFGESYQKIMNSVRRDLYSEGDTKEKQIAMALMLVVDCGIRIGSEKYKNENDSFGATTLESRHVKVHGDTVSVDFIGKKGVRNKCKMRSKRLSRNLRMKKRTLNKDDPIFTYRRGNCWYSLKNTDVNKYLKKFGNFSSKNFRTWVANLSFITEILKSGDHDSENKRKHNINEAVRRTAHRLNNTPIVCKTNYIDPYLIELYLNDSKRFLGTFKHTSTKDEISERYIKLLRSK